MDRDELYKAIEDFFSPCELVDLLGLETSDVIEAFYDTVFESEAVRQMMGISDKNDG